MPVSMVIIACICVLISLLLLVFRAMAKKEINKVKNDLALLLVGRTGNGKSSTGNTILQYAPLLRDVKKKPESGVTPDDEVKDIFVVGLSLTSITKTCQSRTCRRDQQSIKVIDTPDLAKQDKTMLRQEMNKWEDEIKGRECTILLVICCNKRYTREEFDVYQTIKTSFKSFSIHNLVVVFTKGDFLNGRDLRTDLLDTSVELQEVLRDAGWRYVVFDNMPKAAEEDRKEACVKTLMEVVVTKRPTAFPQQICRLLVVGNDVNDINHVAHTMLQDKGNQPHLSPETAKSSVLLMSGTYDGLRLELTVCKDADLAKFKMAVKCSLSPGPHAILRVNNSSPTDKELENVLGKGTLQILLADKKLELSKFIIDIDFKWRHSASLNDNTSEVAVHMVSVNDIPTVLKQARKAAQCSFYMSEDMKKKSEEVQNEIKDTQATYDKYLEVKRKKVKE